MISLEDILTLHYLSIEEFGGAHGVRDEHLLLSAIARPYQTFNGQDLYDTAIAKAAALGESLIKNHPFVDGNKRIGLLAMLAFLKNEQLEVDVPEDILYNFIIDISTSKADYDNIVTRLKEFTSD